MLRLKTGFVLNVSMKPDFEQLIAAQTEMNQAIKGLESLQDDYAKSRQVVEFSSDRRKSALSTIVVEFLKTEQSTSAAEHQARASEQYKSAMKEILTQTIEAEKKITAFNVLKMKFEAARSILSCEKSLLNL